MPGENQGGLVAAGPNHLSLIDPASKALTLLEPHFVLSPAIGAVLMSASTVIVALNAPLLRRSLK
ncbi:hypothetical protein ACFP2F_16905 [Hymenobacter artigasi]|uniref:Cation transport ATPase n=1 Tax=Hymenobacter artigasi TaxID=2719616 RepID=A0ABX1HNW4_9BACT|nr:hypothetical protein [Hymenobacter artigasi]NKI91932.1 cation transport ATPase [Hymenobacter artigasi]